MRPNLPNNSEIELFTIEERRKISEEANKNGKIQEAEQEFLNALGSKSLERSKIALNKGAGFENNFLLDYAIKGECSLEILELLVNAGADVNCNEEDHRLKKRPPLVTAAFLGLPKVCQFLIDHGANITLKSPHYNDVLGDKNLDSHNALKAAFKNFLVSNKPQPDEALEPSQDEKETINILITSLCLGDQYQEICEKYNSPIWKFTLASALEEICYSSHKIVLDEANYCLFKTFVTLEDANNYFESLLKPSPTEKPAVNNNSKNLYEERVTEIPNSNHNLIVDKLASLSKLKEILTEIITEENPTKIEKARANAIIIICNSHSDIDLTKLPEEQITDLKPQLREVIFDEKEKSKINLLEVKEALKEIPILAIANRANENLPIATLSGNDEASRHLPMASVLTPATASQIVNNQVSNQCCSVS